MWEGDLCRIEIMFTIAKLTLSVSYDAFNLAVHLAINYFVTFCVSYDENLN